MAVCRMEKCVRNNFLHKYCQLPHIWYFSINKKIEEVNRDEVTR